MSVAEIILIFAGEYSDEKALSAYVEVPEDVTDPEEWSEELHKQFRHVLLGDLEDKIDYFGHWIDVRVQLSATANTTVPEFFEKAKEYIIEEHGEPSVKTWTYQYWR